MKNYILKVLIAVIGLIIAFELTIGRKFDEINKITESFSTKDGRSRIIFSIKNEMQKAIDKENYLTDEERILINNFISKIKDELKVKKDN
tara:strand:- start:79 stop:348 length:270 start_codon:yes stop_codon:yes gene_type:complete